MEGGWKRNERQIFIGLAKTQELKDKERTK